MSEHKPGCGTARGVCDACQVVSLQARNKELAEQLAKAKRERDEANAKLAAREAVIEGLVDALCRIPILDEDTKTEKIRTEALTAAKAEKSFTKKPRS